jgi:hypothetical protein
MADHQAGTRRADDDRPTGWKRMPRILLTGWFSFREGEVTAGDVLALRRVQDLLSRAGLPYDTVWSPGYRPAAPHLDDVAPEAYSHLLFVCGPLQGPQVAGLHQRFRQCRRIAVGTSVVDPADPAVTGFHRVLARDAPGSDPVRDLSLNAPEGTATPVVGVILTHGQREYGSRRRHDEVADRVTGWLGGVDCAPIALDTRLDSRDWRLSTTADQFQSVLPRLDCVVTDRLHGLVLALRAGTPALAVDPVVGGAKVTAQARACDWPALVPAEQVDEGRLDHWWQWCLSAGREAARRQRRAFLDGPAADGTEGLVDALLARSVDRSGG